MLDNSIVMPPKRDGKGRFTRLSTKEIDTSLGRLDNAGNAVTRKARRTRPASDDNVGSSADHAQIKKSQGSSRSRIMELVRLSERNKAEREIPTSDANVGSSADHAQIQSSKVTSRSRVRELLRTTRANKAERERLLERLDSDYEEINDMIDGRDTETVKQHENKVNRKLAGIERNVNREIKPEVPFKIPRAYVSAWKRGTPPQRPHKPNKLRPHEEKQVTLKREIAENQAREKVVDKVITAKRNQKLKAKAFKGSRVGAGGAALLGVGLVGTVGALAIETERAKALKKKSKQ